MLKIDCDEKLEFVKFCRCGGKMHKRYNILDKQMYWVCDDCSNSYKVGSAYDYE